MTDVSSDAPRATPGDHADPADPAQAPPQDGPAARPDPVADLKAAAGAARQAAAFLTQYLNATLGRVGYSIKRLVAVAILLAILAVIALVLLVTATVLLVVGIAQALAAPLPDAFGWVGFLVVGLLGAVGTPLVAWLFIRSLADSGRRAARDAYVQRLRRQRETLGTDAALKSTPPQPAPTATA